MKTPVDTLLLHGTVVTMNPQRAILADGAVAVQHGRLLEVGSSADLEQRYTATRTLDCRHKMILPGFIDAHGHAGHALLKCVGMMAPSFWMATVTPTYHHFTTDDFWYTDGKLAALERLKMGVTCGVSVMSSAQRSDDPVFACNNARAYAEVGIRGVVAVGPCNPPFPRPFSRWVGGQRVERACSFEDLMAGAEAAIERCHHMADDRIRAFIAPFVLITSLFGSGATPPEQAVAPTEHDRLMTRRVREVAAKYKTRIHTEAFGGMVRLAAQIEEPLLGPDVHLQHCKGISFAEAKILADTGTHVTSSPGANQASVPCPIPEIMTMGGKVCITTDGVAPTISFDLLQAARATQLIQRLRTHDRSLLPEGVLLEMITINPARALGWDDDIGSLEPGKKADLIVLNLWQPHLAPEIMAVQKVMQKAVGHDVETVMVDGEILLDNRRAARVNEADILEEAHEETLRTIRRAGIEAATTLPDGFWGETRPRFSQSPAPCFPDSLRYR